MLHSSAHLELLFSISSYTQCLFPAQLSADRLQVGCWVTWSDQGSGSFSVCLILLREVFFIPHPCLKCSVKSKAVQGESAVITCFDSSSTFEVGGLVSLIVPLQHYWWDQHGTSHTQWRCFLHFSQSYAVKHTFRQHFYICEMHVCSFSLAHRDLLGSLL